MHKYRIWYKMGNFYNCRICQTSELRTNWFFKDVDNVEEIKDFMKESGVFFDPNDYVVTSTPIYNFT
jgi:radical SAM superfamily enzyme YgiQ (UPF0313 family)